MRVKHVTEIVKKLSNDIDPDTEVLGINIFDEFVDFVIDGDRTIRYRVYSPEEITNAKLEDFECCGGKCEM